MESSQHEPWREHVRLLGIFHFIVAGFAALFSMFPIVHLVMGIGMVTGSFPGNGDDVPFRAFGWFFVVFASLIISCGLTFAVLLAIAGRRLLALRSHTFCTVMAAIACLFMPFGTVLGVFTLIVLTKPEVKAGFERGASSTHLAG